MRLPCLFRARSPILPLCIAASLTLAACDTAEERAEKHYTRGVALLEAGDPDRALVEFRNVFQLNNSHVPALVQFAALLEAQGEIQDAAKNYLRIVELDPQNFEAHQHLAQILIRFQDFTDAAVHVGKALELAPQDPLTRALQATLDFRNDQDRPAALAEAQAVVEEAPEIVAAHMVLVADRLNAEDNPGALARVDAALEAVPSDEGLHLARLAILEEMEDFAEVGAELTRMTALFPENDGVRDALVQWHLRDSDVDAAEKILRQGVTPDDPVSALELVQFLYELRGSQAATAELDRLIAEAADPSPYQRARAGIDFTEGRGDAAIAALRALLDGADPSEETRRTQVMLAGMLAETGAAEESDTLVDTVLAEERDNPDALKLRAQRLIAAGDADRAIGDLRLALIKAQNDPDIMTIMAQAYEQTGRRELMRERLALAVELSENGAAESLRYASYLMQEDRLDAAADVLRNALGEAPDDPDLWHMLGQTAIARKDWAEAALIMDQLRASGGSRAITLATQLETESLAAQDKTGLLRALLSELRQAGGSETEMAQEVTARITRGDTAAARGYVSGILSRTPDDISAQLLLAGLYAADSQNAQAETLYRDAMTAAPADARSYEALVSLLRYQGRESDAASVAQAGLDAAGPSADLRLTLASIAETQGDIAQAIAHYDAIYAADPDNLVAANNLASLLSGDIPADPAARSPDAAARLERAATIAQRLKDIAVPPVQDTYGWILFLRGDAQGALVYLDAAAQALADSAQAQYHRAEAAFALGDWAGAETGFIQALAAHEAGSPLPQAEALHARLAEIEALHNAATAAPDAQGG